MDPKDITEGRNYRTIHGGVVYVEKIWEDEFNPDCINVTYHHYGAPRSYANRATSLESFAAWVTCPCTAPTI